MMYLIKVSGTEHIDDYHGKVSKVECATSYTLYDVADVLVMEASSSAWTGITLEYQKVDDDAWLPFQRDA